MWAFERTTLGAEKFLTELSSDDTDEPISEVTSDTEMLPPAGDLGIEGMGTAITVNRAK